MHLEDFLKSKSWLARQLGDAERSELVCRVQIGTREDTIVGELRTAIYDASGYKLATPDDHATRALPKSFARMGAQVERATKTYESQSFRDKLLDVHEVFGFYDELCIAEFDRIPAAFKGEFKDLSYYKSQRPLLYAGGVADVPEMLKTVRQGIRMFGEIEVAGGGQQRLVDCMDRAEKWIDSVPLIGARLKRWAIESIPQQGKNKRRVIGGWSPRPIYGPDGQATSMGPHHVGLALDITAVTNPHLRGSAAAAVDAVLDHLAAKGKFPGSARLGQKFVDFGEISRNPDNADAIALGMWFKMMSISDALKAFLTDCFQKQTNKLPLDADVQVVFDRCKTAFGKGLANVAARGIFDLNLAIVVALINGGMMYGGEFAESKDAHHFQVRDWPYKKPKCVEAWIQKSAARAK